MFLEEKIYLIDLMIDLMNAQTSMHTIMAYRTILNFSENGEEVAPFGKIFNPHNPF